MPNRLTLILLALLACFTVPASAQRQDRAAQNNEASQRLVVNFYEPASDEQVKKLSELIGASINLYLDAWVTYSDGEIRLKKSAKTILNDLNSIVRTAVKYYEYKEVEQFKGFSKELENRIIALDHKKFSDSEFTSLVKDENSEKKYTYYFFQKELSDVKLLANLEVGNYGDRNFLVFNGSEERVLSQAEIDSILNSMNFDPNATLPPDFGDYNSETRAILNTEDRSTLQPNGSSSNSDFEERIMKLLESNTAQLQAMQLQINQLHEDQLALAEARQSERNQELQSQIDDLRSMVIDLVKFNSGSSLADNGENVVLPGSGSGTTTNIPQVMNIRFAKAETNLDVMSVLALNEVVDILARNPQLKVVITGYADKTGNAQVNLALSQRRAKAVKTFLIQSGLPENRFITRYLGDSNSAAENANDRKVAIEFVK
jgi:outer membrane protein OmpA-like peptidoglycan-associated protein